MTTHSRNNLAVVSENWLAAQTVSNLTGKQLKQHNALIAAELYRLKTAYPTQARNFSDEEVDATNALWFEIFAGVDPRILHEAVTRFIVTDRKAFFPAPGQIVGFIEQIIAECKAEEKQAATERHWAQVREYEELIEQGYNCGNCKHCDKRAKKPARYDAWTRDGDENKQALYCTNPQSYYYEGDNHGIGTMETKRCDLFEPQEGIRLPPALRLVGGE
jgi:hypothetical protein